MTDSTWQGNEFGKLVESWMDITKNFWNLEGSQKESASWPGFNFAFDQNEEEAADDERYKMYRTWETAASNFSSFLNILSAPENQEDLSQSFLSFSEAMTQTTGDTLENFIDFQSHLVNSFAKVSEHTKAFSFDEIDHKAFESFRDLYKTEFQKYLHVPKIGLPREFHERISNLIDRNNLFYSYLFELLYLFSVPFEKTNREMQHKISRMLENGDCDCIKDTKVAYNEWIKTLESNFMELLKSGEYTEVLNKTIISLADCKSVRREVMGVFLKDLQIPTNRDMDDVYKDLYQMKKKIRQLSKQVESLQNELKQADPALSND